MHQLPRWKNWIFTASARSLAAAYQFHRPAELAVVVDADLRDDHRRPPFSIPFPSSSIPLMRPSIMKAYCPGRLRRNKNPAPD